MAMTERSTVVGIFTDPGEADLAIEELQLAGFSSDLLSLSRHGAMSSEDGVVGSVKSLFSALKASDRSIFNKLVSMGVPEEEARYYQSELELGRTIVTVEAGDRRSEALVILRRNGAYDATTRRGTEHPNAL